MGLGRKCVRSSPYRGGRLQIARPSGKHHLFETLGIPMTIEMMFLRALSENQEALCNLLTLSEIRFFFISIFARNFDFRKTNVVMSLRIDLAPRQCRMAVMRPLFRYIFVFVRLKSGLRIFVRPRLRVKLDILLLHIWENVVPPGFVP